MRPVMQGYDADMEALQAASKIFKPGFKPICAIKAHQALVGFAC